ncbi:hypothetical protein BDW72DRAFT_183832 [Aspergillus terricola var. indicus]
MHLPIPASLLHLGLLKWPGVSWSGHQMGTSVGFAVCSLDRVRQRGRRHPSSPSEVVDSFNEGTISTVSHPDGLGRRGPR